MYAIRKASISDIPSLYTICLLTGDAGKDATQLYKNNEILGDIYVGPYVQYYLYLTFVLEDSEGICGYIVGSLDIVPFYHYLKTVWYPSLQKKYKRTPFDNQQSKDEHSLIERIHNPDWDILKALYEFPSELHINILPRVQG